MGRPTGEGGVVSACRGVRRGGGVVLLEGGRAWLLLWKRRAEDVLGLRTLSAFSWCVLLVLRCWATSARSAILAQGYRKLSRTSVRGLVKDCRCCSSCFRCWATSRMARASSFIRLRRITFSQICHG